MNKTIQSYIKKSMLEHSDKVAIEAENLSLSYQSLYTQSNLISNALLAGNTTAQEKIGIFIKDKVQIIKALIGCINARCCFVLLDPDMPQARLASIMNGLNLRLVITSKNEVQAFELDVTLLYIENMLDTNANGNAQPELNFDQDDSLYVYYTSGSSGIPKGIVGRNVSLVQFIEWEAGEFGVNEGWRVSQLTSPYFDAFLRDVFLPLLTGGTICIPPQRKDFFTAGQLASWLNEKAVNLVHCVPSIFRILCSAALNAEQFPALKYVLMSGEKINPAELKDWYEVFGERIGLVNFYGATETTMIRCFYRIKKADAGKSKIAIGKPINDTEIWIVNDDLQRCSTLVTGQIMIVSDFISKGYLNTDEPSAKQFVYVNAENGTQKKAYLTGDIGREMIDGNIEYLGRADRQIKFMGIRIEPTEIENVILKHPAVKTALVLKYTPENAAESIVAFYVKKDGQDADYSDAIHTGIINALPPAMVPSRLVMLDELPQLPNGKVNEKELLNLLQPRLIVDPANETEETLLAIWKEILGDKPMSATESFHALGGNSISIMRLIGKIYSQFRVRVPLHEIFKNLTIQKQAAFIKNQKQDDLMKINKAPVQASYALSAAQERIYFSYQLNPFKTSFNIPMVWEIHEEVSVSRVKDVLARLVDRHESLRTRFVEEGNVIRQVVDQQAVPVLELISCPANEVKAKIEAFIRPFDLNEDNLFRAGIIRADNGKHFLVLDLHHIICDGISQTNLLTDFTKLYYNDEVKPLAVQMKDYAEWEHNFMLSEEYFKNREFWHNAFENFVPGLNLPVVNPLINDLTDKGGNISFGLSKDELQPLFSYLNKEEITQYAGIFALYFLFISSISGQDDVVIGSTASGRMQDELENVVGMFVKTLPVRVNINYELTFKQFVKDLHAHLVEVNSKQIYDLTHIMADVNSQNNKPVTSLFDTVFVFLNHEKGKELDTYKEATRFDFQSADSKYPLTLYVKEYDNEINFRLEYSNAYFNAQDAEVLAEQFKEVIRTAMANQDAVIMDMFYSEAKEAAGLNDDIIINL